MTINKVSQAIIAIALGLSFSASAQTPQRPLGLGASANASATDMRRAMTESMSKDSVTTKSGTFPTAATAGAQTGGCEVGQTRSRNVGDINLETPQGLEKNKFVGPQEAIHASSLPWVITKYTLVTMSSNGSVESSLSHYPPNFQYMNTTQYQSEFTSTRNYVASLNIPDVVKADLNLKLDEFSKGFVSFASQISASHGTVRHFAKVNGPGWFNGRNWYRAYVNVEESCFPQDFTNQIALAKTLKTWVDRQTRAYSNLLFRSSPNFSNTGLTKLQD